MNKLNVYERFALEHFLSYYPEDLDLHAIFRLMEEYSEEVIAWELFYNEEPADLVREIENMIIALQKDFVPREGE